MSVEAGSKLLWDAGLQSSHMLITSIWTVEEIQSF